MALVDGYVIEAADLNQAFVDLYRTFAASNFATVQQYTSETFNFDVDAASYSDVVFTWIAPTDLIIESIILGIGSDGYVDHSLTINGTLLEPIIATNSTTATVYATTSYQLQHLTVFLAGDTLTFTYAGSGIAVDEKATLTIRYSQIWRDH